MCILLGCTLGWRLARCSASSCGCCNAAQVVGQFSTRARCRRCEASAVVGGGLEAACRPPPQAAAHDRVAHSNIGDQAHAVRLAFFSISFQAGLRVAALPELTLTVSPCLAGCLRMPVVVSSRQHGSLLPPSAQAPRARTLRAQHVTAHRLRPCGMRRSTCTELRFEFDLTLTWRRSNLVKSTESGGFSRHSALSGGWGVAQAAPRTRGR